MEIIGVRGQICGNYRGRGDKFVEIIGGEGTNVWKL